jgi:hypothetical protein
VSRRALLFTLLCVACVGVASVAVVSAAMRAQADEKESEQAAAVARPTIKRLLADKQPFVLFRSLDRTDGSKYGRLALAPLQDGQAGARLLAGERHQQTEERHTHAAAPLCVRRQQPHRQQGQQHQPSEPGIGEAQHR